MRHLTWRGSLINASVPALMDAILGRDLAWLTTAAVCASSDPEAFFPDKGHQIREAKQLCHSCPLEAACLEYALERPDLYGIWGGTSEHDRRELRRKIPRVTCGTESGYKMHRNRHEKPCDACRAANTAAVARRRRAAS